MTKYEITTLIVSIVALIGGVPGGILSIIDIRARKLRISISYERRYCIPTENNGSYKLAIRYNITNHTSIPFTIKKIQAVYDNNVLEVYQESHNKSGIFENVQIDANSSQECNLAFTYNKPIKKKFTLKIYTNTNVIKRKLSLASNLQYLQENR